MANRDGDVPSQEQKEKETVKVSVVMTFKDNTFHCKVCRNHTQSRNAFEEHIAAHRQLHPYVCISCKTKYKLKSEMDNHVQLVHKDQKVQCAMKGIKDMKMCMNQLLTRGIVKFEGFPRNKSTGISVVSTGAGSQGNSEEKPGDVNQTTGKSTQMPSGSPAQADPSEKVLHKNDNAESKTDFERVTGGSNASSEVEATPDGKTQSTRTNVFEILGHMSKTTDSVDVNPRSVDTSAGDTDKCSTDQNEIKPNIPTLELGEGTSASSSTAGDTSSVVSEQSDSTRQSLVVDSRIPREIELGSNVLKPSRTSDLKCDVEDKDSDSTEQTNNGQAKLCSANKLEQKAVESSETLPDRHLQISSERQESENKSSNVVKGFSASSGNSSSENVSLITSEICKASSSQLESGSSYEIQGSGDASSCVASIISPANSKDAETFSGEEKSATVLNTQDLDLNKQQNIADKCLPQELEVRSHLDQQSAKVTPLATDSKICVLTEGETTKPQYLSFAKLQPLVQSDTLMVSDSNAHRSTGSAENILVMQQSKDKNSIAGKAQAGDICSSNSSLLDNLPTLANNEASVAPKELSTLTVMGSDIIKPIIKEENQHGQKDVQDISAIIKREDDDRKEATDGLKDVLSSSKPKADSTSYVSDLNEACSDTKQINFEISPASSLPQDKGQQLNAATDKDPPQDQEKQLSTPTDHKDPPRDQGEQLTAVSDKDPPQDSGKQLTAASDKDPPQDQGEQLTAASDKDPPQDSGKQLTVASDKDPPQDQEKQLSTSTDHKDPPQDQGEQLNAPSDKDLPQDQGIQLPAATEGILLIFTPEKGLAHDQAISPTAAADKDLSGDKSRHLIAAVGKNSQQDQQDQSTAATYKDPPRDQEKQLNAATEGILLIFTPEKGLGKDSLQDQQDQPTAATYKDPLHSQGKHLTAVADKDSPYDQERPLTSSTGDDTPQVKERQLSSLADNCSPQGRLPTTATGKDTPLERQPMASVDKGSLHDKQDQPTATTGRDSLQNQLISTTEGLARDQILPTDAADKDNLPVEGRQITSTGDKDSPQDQARLPKTTVDKTLISFVSSPKKEERDESPFKDPVKSKELNMIAIPLEDKKNELDVTTNLSLNKWTSPVKPSVSNDSDEDGHISSSQGSYSDMLKVNDENERIVKSNLSTLNYSGSNASSYVCPVNNATAEISSTANERPSVGESFSDPRDQSVTTAVLSTTKKKDDSPQKAKTMLERNVYQQRYTIDKHPGIRQVAGDPPRPGQQQHNPQGHEQQRKAGDGNKIVVRGPSPVSQQREVESRNQTKNRSPSPVPPQQRQVQSVNHTQVRGPSPVGVQQQTPVQDLNQTQVRAPSPVYSQQQRQLQDLNQTVYSQQQRQVQGGNQIQIRGPSPVPMQQQRQVQSGNQTQVRAPSPVYTQQQRQLQDLNQTQVRAPSPVYSQHRQVQSGNQTQSKGPSPVPMQQQRQVQVGNQTQVRAASPVYSPQQRQVQGGNQNQVRTPSPVYSQQRQVQGVNQIQSRGPSPVPLQQQRQVQVGNQTQVRAPSPVYSPQQRQVQGGNQNQVRTPSPVYSQQRQVQGVNQIQSRGPSPVPMQQQRQVQSGNQTQVRASSPVYLHQQQQQQQPRALRRNDLVDMDAHAILQEHEKRMAEQMSIFNLTQSRQRIVSTSTTANNSNVNNQNVLQANNSSARLMPCQVTSVASNQGYQMSQQSRAYTAPTSSVQSLRPPLGQFMAIVSQADMTPGIRPAPAMQQMQIQGNTIRQPTGKLPGQQFSHVLGATPAGFPNSISAIQSNFLQFQQQTLISQTNMVTGVPQGQTASVPQQVPGIFGTMPAGMLITGQGGSLMGIAQLQQNQDRSSSGLIGLPQASVPQGLGYMPPYVLSPDGTLRPTTQLIHSIALQAQGQNMNQTQVRGPSPVYTQQQSQIHSGNQTQVRGPSPVYTQQQSQARSGNQTQVRAPSPVYAQQQSQAQSGNQTQVRGPSPVPIQQQRQVQGGNQAQVRGPSPVYSQQQQQVQSGNQTQVRGPSPVGVQQQTPVQSGTENEEVNSKRVSGSETCATVGKISKQTSLKAKTKIAELLRKSRGDKQLQNKESSQLVESEVSGEQNSDVQPGTETMTVQPGTETTAVQPVSAVKKKDKGTFRKVGPDFLCNACKIETQSENDFRAHIWQHLHIIRKMCTDCLSSIDNTTKCQLVMSVIDGLKYGCSGASSDTEPVQIKDEPEDDDVVILEHVPPPRRARHLTLPIKQEVAQIASSNNTVDVSATQEGEMTFQEKVSSGVTTGSCGPGSCEQESTSGVASVSRGETPNLSPKIVASRVLTKGLPKKTAEYVSVNPRKGTILSRGESNLASDAEKRNVMAQTDFPEEPDETRSSSADAEAAGTPGGAESAAPSLRCDPLTEVTKDNTSKATTDKTSKDQSSTNKLIISDSGRKLIYKFVSNKKQRQVQSGKSNQTQVGGSSPVPMQQQKQLQDGNQTQVRGPSPVPPQQRQVEGGNQTQVRESNSTESENMSTDQSVVQSDEAEPDPIPLERTTGNFYVCCGFSSCKFSCLVIADFYKHMFTVHSKAVSFQCVHCGYPCSSPQLLIRHLHTHLKSTSIFFSCCISGCRFETNILYDYSSHLRQVHSRSNTFTCNICKTGFTSVDQLIQHFQENTLKFVRCPHCKVADTDAKLIKQHLASTHPGESRHVMVACELVCQERRKNNFVRRTIGEESSTSASARDKEHATEVPQQTDTTGPTFEGVSDTTGPTFEGLSDTDEDEETSSEDKTSEERTTTEEKTHEEDKTTENHQTSVESVTPDNAVNTKPSLSLNMQETVVSEISACDSTVSPTPSLSHLDGSVNEEDPFSSDGDSSVSTILYKCPECSYATKKKISIRHHEKIHARTLSEKNVFACPLCPDGMAMISSFRDHMRSHIGNHTVTMYYCDLCQIVTNEQETILTHGNQFHRNFNKDTDISTRDMKFSFFASKVFACDKCDHCTTSQEVYNTHVETHAETHVAEEQKCPYCIYHTQDEETFHLHITNMHQKQLNKEKRNQENKEKRNRKSSLERERSSILKSEPKESESAQSFTQSIHSSENLQDKASPPSTAVEHSRDQIDLPEKSTPVMSQELASQAQSKPNDLYQSQVSKRYHCCECTKCFSSSDQLKTHLEFHAKMTKKNYQIKLLKCSHCDYTTTERLWLERHNREQHKNNSKSTKQCREVIRVGQGTSTETSNSPRNVEPAVVKTLKAFLIPVQTTFPQPVRCCECDFSTRDRASLVIHVTKHPTLYPSFEDPNDSPEDIKNEKDDSGTVSMETKNVSESGKKTERKLLDTPSSTQTADDVSSDDSGAEQDVINLMTDESTDEYEKDETTSEKDHDEQLVGYDSNTSEKVTQKSSSIVGNVATLTRKTGRTSQEVVAEAVARRPHRKSQDCDSLFRLGGDLLHAKLKPCFSQGKDNMFVCDLCSDGFLADKYEFHKHLLRHMNLWFFMCGYCDFHCFEQTVMTSHLTKLHKNRPCQILKMEVDDFRNRINEIIHCRKAGVSMSSLISVRTQNASRSLAEENIKDTSGRTIDLKGRADGTNKTKTGKSSPEKDSVLGSEKSLTSQKKSGVGTVTTVGKFHKCSICGFKANNRHAVVRHMGVHSQLNKHHCQLCPFQSSIAGDLSRHMTKRHPETCQEKPSKTPYSKELKELLKDLVETSPPRISTSTGNTNSSASKSPTAGKTTSSSIGKKSAPALKAPKTPQKGAVKTILRSELKKKGGLWKCNFCHYGSKWATNMARHMKCIHKVKVIFEEKKVTGENGKSDDVDKDDAESDDVESDNAESDDADSDAAENDAAESDDAESGDGDSDGDSDGVEIEDTQTSSDDSDGKGTRSVDHTKSDDEESNDTQGGKKGQGKLVLYTCDVKVDANGRYQCPLCTSVLRVKANLYRHALEVHNADVIEGYTCLTCKKDFRLKTPFLKHLVTGTRCDKPWFLCTSKQCTEVFFEEQKAVKHIQKEHSGNKDPIVFNTRKMKLERCKIKGNLMQRRNKEKIPTSKKEERTLPCIKVERTPSKKEERSPPSKKEERSPPSKKEERSPSKKNERSTSNLCYSKSPGMKDVQCGDCNVVSRCGFVYQLHCNNKHPARAICCFYCRKLATISVRQMVYHTIDIHKEKVLKFYSVPRTEANIKIGRAFKNKFNGKRANLNKSIITTNLLYGYGAVNHEKISKKDASETQKNTTASEKQKKTPTLKKEKKAVDSAGKEKKADSAEKEKKAVDSAEKEKKVSLSKKQAPVASSVSSEASEDRATYRCMVVKGCGVVSNKYDGMLVHIQKHLKYKPFKCEICGVQFYMEQHVKIHHTKIHGSDHELNIAVNRKAALELKIAGFLRKGHPQYFVNKTFTVEDVKKLRNGPKRLYREFGGKQPLWKCKECPYEANTRKKITDHVYTHLPQFYKCPFCNHTGYPRFLVVDHIINVHPTENPATPVINLMNTNWKQSPDDDPKEPSSASHTSSESSDADVYSGEEANRPRTKHASAKTSGKPNQMLDADPPKRTPKTRTGAIRKRARTSTEDSDDEDEDIKRKRKCQKQKASTSRSCKKTRLTSSSDTDEEDGESEETTESSSSEQDTYESSSANDDDEEVIVSQRRKRHRSLTDSTSDETDHGPTRYFCHQCCFRSEDLKVYCRHLVTHGGFNQLSPQLLPKDLRKPVEKELARIMEETSWKEGPTFRCAYCSFMAVTSFRVKQHIVTNHPDNYTDYMEIHTKYQQTKVMVVAMQPTITVTDICKMDLMDLAMMLAHEGVKMNSGKSHHGEGERSETGGDTSTGSSGEKRRRQFSIMSPSKYYKKSRSHSDVHQKDVRADDKEDGENLSDESTEQRTEEMTESCGNHRPIEDEEDRASSSDHSLPSEEMQSDQGKGGTRFGNSTRQPRNIFNALVKLTHEKRNVHQGFEDVFAEYLSAEDKGDTNASMTMNVVYDQKKMQVPKSSGTDGDSLGTGNDSLESKVESTVSLPSSSTIEESLPDDDNIVLEDKEENSLESPENSFETKVNSRTAANSSLSDIKVSETIAMTTDIYEDISECSESSEGQTGLGGHLTSGDVRDKGQIGQDVGLTTVSSTTDHVDISDCSDSILSKEDNLCEETSEVSEMLNTTNDETFYEETSEVSEIPNTTEDETLCEETSEVSEIPNTTEDETLCEETSEVSDITNTTNNDTLCEETSEVSEIPNTTNMDIAQGHEPMDQGHEISSATQNQSPDPSSSVCVGDDVKSHSECEPMETDVNGGFKQDNQGTVTVDTERKVEESSPMGKGDNSEQQLALPKTSQTAKGGNSLPLEITGDNVMSSIDSMLDSLSDIRQSHVTESPVKLPADQDVKLPADQNVKLPADQNVKLPADKDVKLPADHDVVSTSSAVTLASNRDESADSDNESCHSIGFEVNTNSQEL